MQIKTILAALAVAGVASASPVEDLEVRGDLDARNSYQCSGKAYCCATALNYPILFFSAVGSDCISASMIPRADIRNAVIN
jgi:hypothetical protein